MNLESRTKENNMRRILGWSLVAVMAVALAGCATEKGHSSKDPCADCTYAYVPAGKQTNRKAVCVVNGKLMDCTKSPPECPECAKKLQEKQ
jgi:hypothetical protein